MKNQKASKASGPLAAEGLVYEVQGCCDLHLTKVARSTNSFRSTAMEGSLLIILPETRSGRALRNGT